MRVGQTIDAMYIGFNSNVLAPNQITDYLVRVVQPKLQAVPGVQTAEILGGKILRAARLARSGQAGGLWPDRRRCVAGARGEQLHLRPRQHQGPDGAGDLTASTDLHSLDEFRDLVAQAVGGAIVRLKDVANVSLGFDDYETEVGFDGQRAVYIGIQVAPAANLLDVIHGVRAVFPGSSRNCRRD